MTLAPGARVGPYEIVAALGSGGMGEVFRARDTKLGRDVALKLLPDAAAHDPERLARFEREARTLASLNHPAIVTIYAVEEAAGTHFIAMACVEGRTLADVMPAGGLPLDRLLAIAVPLADAVGTAHQHDIVHRDLKPANVMIGSHDRVTVLDFGLAKLCETAPATEATMLPARDLTGEGRIVGTVAYMSPEQAEGTHVDERSDVFSLGVLLYEMATGARPFTGDTSLSVLSAILKDSPKPLTDLNPMLPRELSRIVRRCLVKDPDRRYQSAMDLRNDLEDLQHSALSGELHAVSPLRPEPPSRFWPVATAVVTTGALLAVSWLLMRPPAALPESIAAVMASSRLTMQEGVALDPSISPDGKWVVYVGSASGNQDIYLHSVTGQTAINLTQDSSAADTAPVFSPDGESIAFRSARDGGGLYVMGRTGESVRRLTQRGFQPAWFPDGRQIVFATQDAPNVEGRGGGPSELWIVNATGGEPRRLFAGDAVQPRVSPNGRRIAFWNLPTDAELKRFAGANRDIWTVAVDGTSPVRVTSDEAIDWNPVWSPDGRWLYFLSNRSGSMNLWRIAIDEASGATSGQPQPLTVPASYIRHFSFSADGRIGTYATWAVTNNLARARFDPRDVAVKGPLEPITTGPRDFATPDVSPDGQSLAVATSNRQQEDVYVIAANGSGLRNVTNDRFRDRVQRWAPDGRRILFYSDRGGPYNLWSIDRDGSGLRQLTKSEGRYYPVPSRDGSTVAAAELSTWELYLYDARDFSKPPEKLPPFPEELRSATLVPSDWSPDGRLLTGFSAGAVWVYSRDTRAYRRVADGAGPTWLPDGRRLLFVRQGRVFVTDWQSGEPRQVFSIPGEAVGAPRLSVDGSFLYFLHGSASGDIWVVRFSETATDASKD